MAQKKWINLNLPRDGKRYEVRGMEGTILIDTTYQQRSRTFFKKIGSKHLPSFYAIPIENILSFREIKS